jgi:hypothetical protein
MAKPKGNLGITNSPKARGRTARTESNEPRVTQPHLGESARGETTRPIGSGPGHRGDRRDTSRLYTNNAKHSARGNTPRADVKTRKR